MNEAFERAVMIYLKWFQEIELVRRHRERKRARHVREQVAGSLAGYYDKPVVRRKRK